MNYQFELLKQTRRNVLNLISDLSERDLLKIPARFKNNILWNMGHIIVIQQLLFYKSMNLKPAISEELIPLFKKDTSPKNWPGKPDSEHIKALLTDTVEKAHSDYNNGLLKKERKLPQPVKMQYGNIINTMEEIIIFNNLHEALHLGIIMQINKFI